jgi:hypothetical protein
MRILIEAANRLAALAPAVLACSFCFQGQLRASTAEEGNHAPASTAAEDDRRVSKVGRIEVTAELVEIRDGAIFKRDLYNYATVLKYEVLKVHRGKVEGKTIYVGHYNPFKPRSEAADRHVKGIGGDLKLFRAGEVHHMALDVPIEDHFMGGIVNKYLDETSDSIPIYWGRWTNLVVK